MSKPLIGLTGGIASGKSTVAGLFADLGVGVVDADQVAREVVMPDTPALGKIIEHFGPTVLTAEGLLNRAALREQIFKDPQQRVWLEQLLHPLIRERMLAQAATLQSPYGLLMIPLLTDPTRYPLTRICVVDMPEQLQLQRLQARDALTLAQAQAIVAAQASREQRLRLAHDVIDNQGDRAALQAQVARLHEIYFTLRAK